MDFRPSVKYNKKCPAHLDDKNHMMRADVIVCHPCYKKVKAHPALKRMIWSKEPSDHQAVIGWLIEAERKRSTEMEELKESVVKILISKYDFLPEDAASTVDESVRKNSEMWNENADENQLAEFLASDEDDD